METRATVVKVREAVGVEEVAGQAEAEEAIKAVATRASRLGLPRRLLHHRSRAASLASRWRDRERAIVGPPCKFVRQTAKRT